MRKLIGSALLAAAVTVSAQTVEQTYAEAERLPALKASIYGTPLTGARELVPLLASKKSDAEGHAIYQAALRKVRMGESFQVNVKTPVGTDITQNPRTKYAGDGCLLVSTSGFVTVAAEPGMPCRPGSITELWVSLVDTATPSKSQAWNRYAFLITQ